MEDLRIQTGNGELPRDYQQQEATSTSRTEGEWEQVMLPESRVGVVLPEAEPWEGVFSQCWNVERKYGEPEPQKRCSYCQGAICLGSMRITVPMMK